MVVKSVVKMPAAVNDTEDALSDKQRGVVKQSLGVRLQQLVLFLKQSEESGVVKILRQLLKPQHVGLVTEIYLCKMQVAVVNLAAPDVVRHDPDVGSLFVAHKKFLPFP